VLPLVPALIGSAATVLLAGGAVYARALTAPAGAVAVVFGITIVVFAGFPYLALLILFVVASVLATRYRFDEKRNRHVQEGTAGERGVSNVLAHILIPTALAVAGGIEPPALPSAALAVLFTAALAFGASDTFASEFGVLAGSARSILTGKRVTPGTNGGISGIGEAFAFAGAATTGLVAVGLFALFGMGPAYSDRFLLAVVVAGFLACQLDSVLGETLENRGMLTKGSTNFFGMLGAVAMAGAIFVAAGGSL
jgi:uncharacterized protein (TIGR00297 family)